MLKLPTNHRGLGAWPPWHGAASNAAIVPSNDHMRCGVETKQSTRRRRPARNRRQTRSEEEDGLWGPEAEYGYGVVPSYRG